MAVETHAKYGAVVGKGCQVFRSVIELSGYRLACLALPQSRRVYDDLRRPDK